MCSDGRFMPIGALSGVAVGAGWRATLMTVVGGRLLAEQAVVASPAVSAVTATVRVAFMNAPLASRPDWAARGARSFGDFTEPSRRSYGGRDVAVKFW